MLGFWVGFEGFGLIWVQFGEMVGFAASEHIPPESFADEWHQIRVSTDAPPWARSRVPRLLLKVDKTPHPMLTRGQCLLSAWVTYSVDAPKVVTRCHNANADVGTKMRC